ncbi:response regulator [Foetidibacter luteolus]|uniref:response regulator n=1 Tax=Foetidibacter luteolus TaxID=2608880 RepID=UPI00129AD7E5|nr:response regulator [Foetidibacter luteolus]
MGRKLLIIDDDSKNIFALTATLKSKGFQTVSATAARDGIDMMGKDNEISLVLMDMMMPEMDGYEAIQLMKADDRFKNIPVIAVTAQAMKGDKEKCLAAGADNYISKPVDVDALLLMLNDYLK